MSKIYLENQLGVFATRMYFPLNYTNHTKIVLGAYDFIKDYTLVLSRWSSNVFWIILWFASWEPIYLGVLCDIKKMSYFIILFYILDKFVNKKYKVVWKYKFNWFICLVVWFVKIKVFMYLKKPIFLGSQM